ncbi:MAG TPA: hypothetical protein PLI68_14510, partial [Bacteroidia bacterium]|nr:hypothetical protein [Bacteroidia bacterium]
LRIRIANRNKEYFNCLFTKAQIDFELAKTERSKLKAMRLHYDVLERRKKDKIPDLILESKLQIFLNRLNANVKQQNILVFLNYLRKNVLFFPHHLRNTAIEALSKHLTSSSNNKRKTEVESVLQFIKSLSPTL